MLLNAKNTCILQMKQAKKFAFKSENIASINQRIKEFVEKLFN